jgi:hypothetical protein
MNIVKGHTYTIKAVTLEAGDCFVTEDNQNIFYVSSGDIDDKDCVKCTRLDTGTWVRVPVDTDVLRKNITAVVEG